MLAFRELPLQTFFSYNTINYKEFHLSIWQSKSKYPSMMQIAIVCQNKAIFIIASLSNGQATNIYIYAHLKDAIP